ncbi:hypothetical protein GPL10_02855 [Bacteroides fragilis]|uniref:Transmembrane protein n=1 Tax=Bacteroides fragilis (strain YCH46) TaxID=295405 RepID=Q64ZM8_BACFR|nr:hypothetical protein [Bacteroides fragilis]RGJ15081.1 hypothetical protein DXD74_11285 [Bacteroides fragilis]RHM85105.1 hypothetical protein DWZ39_15100 [Bacteroides fragilis]BAD47048.1 hypothetical protein BF0299 [Bacteroides fragilis YCH46]
MKLPNYSRKNFLIIFDGFSFLFRLCIDNQFLICYFIFWRKNDFFFEIVVFDCLFPLFL